MLLNVKAKVATFRKRIKIVDMPGYVFQFVLIIVEDLPAEVSDAFGCTLNSQFLDQFSC